LRSNLIKQRKHMFVNMNTCWHKLQKLSVRNRSSIYNFLCNQCLSPLMLWVRISIRSGWTIPYTKWPGNKKGLLRFNLIKDFLKNRFILYFKKFFSPEHFSAYHHWCCEFESRSGWGVQYYVIKFVSELRQVCGFLVFFVICFKLHLPVFTTN
jgi:hypothetical protein